MTIRTKLQLSTFIQIMLVILVAVALTVTFRGISRANAKIARADELSEAITQIRFVTFENLVHHDERSYQQWQWKYNDITASLTNVPEANPAERTVLADILKQHQAIKPIFDRLVSSYSQSSGSQDQATLRDFQERLAGQLLIKQQIQVSGALKLAALNRDEIQSQQVRFSWIVVIAILLMVLATTINAVLTNRSITTALARLQEGAAAIAAGNLKYRIKPFRNHDEFHQLATSFNSMATSLEAVDSLKSEFVMLASHQLRTPATAVKDSVMLLLDGYAGPITSQQAEHLRAAYAENEKQLQIVDQLIEVAKAKGGAQLVMSTETDIGELVDGVVAENLPGVQARNQTLTFEQSDSTIMLPVDPEKLRMAISNLIDNAKKYSPEGASITVKLGSDKKQVTIKVHDTGYGIAVADKKKLFQKFSRLPNPNSIAAGGSGLGLYLTKRIIDLHKGHLTVDSELGKGTTFTIKLPIGD